MSLLFKYLLQIIFLPRRCANLKSLSHQRRWLGRLALLLCTWGYWMQPVQAEGSRNLYPSGATGFRANLEWRSTDKFGPTTPADNSLLRRTLLQVYAKAGEYILLGSSSVGVDNADILLYGSKTGRIGNETLSNLKFQCSTQRTQTANTNQGKISSRNQELAGPDTITNPTTATPGGAVTNGYVPCYYQVPVGGDGIYYVAFYGGKGGNSNFDGTPTPAINFGTNFKDPSGTSIAAWDVTVRSSLTSTTDINGRLFADYLALFTGDNGRPIESSFYIVTKDGYQYKTALNGLDPNGFVIYGNDVGYYDSDGKTPLYHDVLSAVNNALMPQLQGGTNFALPSHIVFFSNPQTSVGTNDSLFARGIPTVAILPSVSNSSFIGTAGANNSNQSTGGVFKFDSNVTGNYEIVISRDGTDFDPANLQNRVLRGTMTAPGGQTVTWDGTDNSGNFFPVGTDYPVNITTHAGEYHFPLIDAENSTKGGPSFTLLNVTNPLGNNTGFYDDRGYRTLSGTNVGTPGGVLCGGSGSPPSISHSNLSTGFNTTSTQRAFGAASGGNTNTVCTGSFGDVKGLDIWTYVPSNAVLTYLNIIPTTSYQVSPLAGQVIINEVLYKETGTTTDTNDEFIELYNASTSPVDLSGVRLTDSNVIVGSSDAAGGFHYTFPSGTTLQPGKYAVIWIGNNNANHQATGAAFQAWLGQTPKLNNSGDDVWLYDNQNKIVDYIAYGAGSEVNTPPPTALNLWDNTYQSSLAGANSGQSISLTPNGKDTNVSACWEATTSGNSSTRCTNYLPTRDTDTTGSRVTSVGESNNGATTVNAKLLLVKRITRINNQDLTDIVDGRSDVAITAANYVPEPYASDDNYLTWPAGYLRGLINAGTVKPGDELEYTIYFLSKGPNDATNVKFCDLVPSSTTFIPTAFNGNTPRDGGLTVADQGIALALGSSNPTVYLTNIEDTSDRGRFYAANDPAPSYCGANTNGAVLVNITRSPDFPNLAKDFYGFVRFRARVK
ncbi:lamin tail domain-containing protein [Nostoc sp.]|uniref:lamin tail domain-containing protein n=1 Tax=Nostoc sp. TaxID=1180 RepID=UPI002FFA9C42